MILVQHGRGGWVNSRTTLAKAMAIAGVVVMLAMVAGCSSKKAGAGARRRSTAGSTQRERHWRKQHQSLKDCKRETEREWRKVRSATFISATTTIRSRTGRLGAEVQRELAEAHPQTKVQVEGHCDERGSEEYNIALGAKRAQAAKDYLVTLGIDGRPNVDHQLRQGAPALYRGHDESCWHKTGAITSWSSNNADEARMRENELRLASSGCSRWHSRSQDAPIRRTWSSSTK